MRSNAARLVSSDSRIVAGRQFLVTDRQSSIMSNTVAVMLTLAGPRLWILIKALLFAVYGYFQNFQKRQHTESVSDLELATSPGSASAPADVEACPEAQSVHTVHSLGFPRRDLLHHGIDTTKSSHTELGAARSLIYNVWEELRANQLMLRPKSTRTSRNNSRTEMISRFWHNFIRRAFEITTSLLLSIIFIAIFVVESSGSVLSANIVSDATAPAASSDCGIPHGWFYYDSVDRRAKSYQERCYQKYSRADDCDHYSSQSLTYKERSNASCPFLDKGCLQGKTAAYTLDTGYIDAKFLGFNAGQRHLFRRKSTCSPVASDGESFYLHSHLFKRKVSCNPLLGECSASDDIIKERFYGCDVQWADTLMTTGFHHT